MAPPPKRRRLTRASHRGAASAPWAPSPPTSIRALAVETMLQIAELSQIAPLMNLARTCRDLYGLLRPVAVRKDIHEEGRLGRSALLACIRGDVNLLRICLDAGLSPLHATESALHPLQMPSTIALWCITHQQDRVDLLKELLAAGLDIHDVHGISGGQHPGLVQQTILHEARNPAMIAFLLAIGYQNDINTVRGQMANDVTRPPLSNAVRRRYGIEAVRVLLDAGADLRQLNVHGTRNNDVQNHLFINALADAIAAGDDFDLVRLLVARGAALNNVPQGSCKPCALSVLIDTPKDLNNKLMALVPLGLDLNDACPLIGGPPLWVSFEDVVKPETVQVVLKWGADPRYAVGHSGNFYAGHTVEALQALLLTGYEGSLIPPQAVIQRRRAKARALIAAEGLNGPKAPVGWPSMLQWALDAVSMDRLELAIRTLEPWVDADHIGPNVAMNWQNRLSANRPDFYFGRENPIRRIESILREWRVDGFVTNHRPSRRDRKRPVP